MRLLRDKSRVLEYLSKRGYDQAWPMCIICMKRRWCLQLPEYIGSVEKVIQIIKFIA